MIGLILLVTIRMQVLVTDTLLAVSGMDFGDNWVQSKLPVSVPTCPVRVPGLGPACASDPPSCYCTVDDGLNTWVPRVSLS